MRNTAAAGGGISTARSTEVNKEGDDWRRDPLVAPYSCCHRTVAKCSWFLLPMTTGNSKFGFEKGKGHSRGAALRLWRLATLICPEKQQHLSWRLEGGGSRREGEEEGMRLMGRLGLLYYDP